MKFFIPFFLVILFISGCSTKEVFEPKVVDKPWQEPQDCESEIVDVSSGVALLENHHLLTKSSELNITIQPKERVIGVSDGWVITTTIDGNVTLRGVEDENLTHKFELKKTVATASVSNGVLAVVFGSNALALYDTATKALLFKEEGGKVVALNAQIQQPYFMNGLVIFSTLDGKVVIVNIAQKKRLRTVLISSEDFFNNIISFGIVQNKIIAASGYELLSLSQQEIRKKYDIRDVVYNDDIIYITTKQGELISLTPALDVITKVKFPFAHFLGMIVKGDFVYLLEKEGYIIKVDKHSFAYTVHKVDLEDGMVFVGDDAFYVDDTKIDALK